MTAGSDIYTVERYYCRDKSISSLRNLIVQVKQANETNYRLYFCVIYSRSSVKYDQNQPIISKSYLFIPIESKCQSKTEI